MACPSCSNELPGEFPFCPFCGAPLALPAPERRKLATLLFCDMSGSTALGGRAIELAALEALFGDAAAERRCLRVTIVGEPGVGKSRLVAEFVSRLGPTATVLRGRCLSYGEGITYW